jgi:hypothetical protein
MLNGTIFIGGQEWTVREEKQGGPHIQLLSLAAVNSLGARVKFISGTQDVREGAYGLAAAQ